MIRGKQIMEEEKMHETSPAPDAHAALATLADVRRLVGNLENGKALEILALHPTTEELEEAAMWAQGNGDFLGKDGHALSGAAAAIFDILMAEEDEPSPLH